ncbi:hypothetical protein A2Z00_03815 [Candidatus Gottesmanbacteria bacterium RBG_13_45_10]|uniref:Four helix bundle protein n=1 Tax=Candidatus Gottesmanbacteria bacterium RBG_13_45_10 TaxID=1798370 RepID=A0A1F5ZHL1_9BACT|nr:MAG: hypothetical protein A2Z00_03815 [Candidatus Gottesmanbacteria bacterium RBG_13_45_10]
MELIGYKRLIVWQKTDELALLIYKITASFPKSEIFSLTSQLRRAALSVPTNIVEGYARNSRIEFKRFIVIALGSLAETKYLLDVSFRLKYIDEGVCNKAMYVADESGRLLWKLYRSIK